MQFVETYPGENIRRNDREELKPIRQTHFNGYHLSSFRVTRKENVMTVTYFVQLNIIVDGQPVSLPNSIRLSVWQKVNGQWKWVAQQAGV